ncbi:hypothetical protein JW848_00570, partial [Candidatus Bipolaricaulota bacterium]|nr:hypothetical protein [Candidatus Bipolaricaulota bacterium]
MGNWRATVRKLVGVVGMCSFLLVGAALVGFSPRVQATTLTPVVGIDPTGVVTVGAWAETPVGEFLQARAGIAVSVVQSARLLLAGGGIAGSIMWGALEPTLGVGVGAALAPTGFTSGAILEIDLGARVWIVDWLAVLTQM